jgi:hypothetical protein
MDSAKFQKLKDYVNLLVQQGDVYEKEKEYVMAIEKYLKVVDILLVMGDEAPNYPLWVQCTDKAQAFQKKIKNLIALASIEEEKKKLDPGKTSQSQPVPSQTVVAPDSGRANSAV